jgi:hypothetical protein
LAAEVNENLITNWSQLSGLLFDDLLRSFGLYGFLTNTFFVYQFEKAHYFSLDGAFFGASDHKRQKADLMDFSLNLFDQLSVSREQLVSQVDLSCQRIDNMRIEAGEREDYVWHVNSLKQAANDWRSVHRAFFVHETQEFESWDFFDLTIHCLNLQDEDSLNLDEKEFHLKQTSLGHRETNRSVSAAKYIRHLESNAETFRVLQVN